MIDRLIIKNESEDFKKFIDKGKTEKELNLKKVNIFVGENNSGKSYFMREVFKSFRKKEIKDKIIGSRIEKKIEFPNYFSLSFSNSLIKRINNEIIQSVRDIEKEGGQVITNEMIRRLLKKEDKSFYERYENILNGFSIIAKKSNKLNQLKEKVYKDLNKITYSTFIPILRSLKELNENNLSLRERTIEDYFKKLNRDNTNIFTGEELFSSIKSSLLSYSFEREKIRNFENFLKTIFNKKVELIPREKGEDNSNNSNNDLYVKLGEEDDLPIQKLGDGIQSLIILTFQIFMNQDKNHLIFIEEPEQNIHPGLQRVFLELIGSDRFPNTQVFFTTHSNHFLDMAIENSSNVSVHTFQKKVEGKEASFEIKDITNKASEALDLLGARTSSVFLSNCTIWVEGISDRIYIRHFLKMYMESTEFNKLNSPIYKEDIHYSFIEYAGSNLTHWSFYEDDDPNNPDSTMNYEALNKNVFLIADKDDNKEDKHTNLNKKLGNNYYVLPCREIENLLSPKVLVNTILEYKKEDVELNPSEFTEYQNKRIGNFIKSKIENSKFQSFLTTPNSKKNIFIRNKRMFANNAIKHIKIWDDLPKDAKDLTRAIYSFIRENNN